jgi:hypothetical protein
MAKMILHREERPMRSSIMSIPSIKSILSIAILAFTPLALADEPAPEKESAPSFTLPDSNKGLVRVKWPREKPVFLTFGEQASQTQIQAWSGRMKQEYTGKVEFIGIAWLVAVPENMRVAAETVIRTTHPEVLLDWSGSCAERYQCKPGGVNAFLIAPDGVILKRIHEDITEERFQAVQEALKPFLIVAADQKKEAEEKQP